MSEQKVILKTEHLVRWFGALKATNDVSLDIYDGERACDYRSERRR